MSDFKLTWHDMTNSDIVDKLSKSHVIAFEISDIEILDEKKINNYAFSKAGLKKQPDLLYLKFKLAHEGANKNKDGFKKEDLEKAKDTPVLKLIDWEHKEKVIGSIYHSEFVDSTEKEAKAKKEKAHIVCEGVVYKYKFPDEAKKIVSRYKNGILGFSMEAWYASCECSVCGEQFPSELHDEGEYCEHLNARHNEAHASYGAIRYLKDFFFSGVGVVEDPADVEAGALALANKKEGIELAEEKTYTKEDLEKAALEAVEKYKKESDASKIEEENRALKASMEEKDKLLTEATENIKTLSSERDELKGQLENIKVEAEKKEKRDSRLKILEEAGWKKPEDEEEFETAMATILAMDDNVFNYHVETLKANIVKKEEAPERPANASLRIPQKISGNKGSEKKMSIHEELGILLMKNS